MTYQNKQRTRIEDLPDDGNELFDLSEEVLTMVGVFGGSGASGNVDVEAPDDEIQTKAVRPCGYDSNGYVYCTYDDDDVQLFEH